MRYLLVLFDYSMVFMDNDSVCGVYSFMEKRSLTVVKNLLVSVILHA